MRISDWSSDVCSSDLVEHTDPALVAFEIDTGWVAAAGHDPIATLKRYPGRFRLIHMKDIASETVPNYAFKQMPAIPGQGVLDWTALLPAAKAAGVTGWYVEQEGPFAGPRTDAIAYLSSHLHPPTTCSHPTPTPTPLST